MTHTETLAILAALLSPGPADRPGQADREAALAHVARCSDCWASLVSLHELVTGSSPSESARMAELYGCDRVQPGLHLLVGREADAVAREHPLFARHLLGCLACRSRLAELEAVERETRGGTHWIEVVTRAGEAAYEAVGRLVVCVGRATAGLASVPDGFLVLESALAPAPVRGATPEAIDAVALAGRSASFALGETGVAAEVAVDAEDDDRVGLTLRLTTPVLEPVSVHVREVRPEGEVLVARHTLRGPGPVVVRGLWPGSFFVELHHPEDAPHYRVRLDIGTGA